MNDKQPYPTPGSVHRKWLDDGGISPRIMRYIEHLEAHQQPDPAQPDAQREPKTCGNYANAACGFHQHVECDVHGGGPVEAQPEPKDEHVERMIHRADERATARYNERRDQLRGVALTGLPEDNEQSYALKEGRKYGFDQGQAAGYASRDAEITALRADVRDWRNGVELIASALGDAEPADLSCVRISELALETRARAETAEAERDELATKLAQMAPVVAMAERNVREGRGDYGLKTAVDAYREAK